MASVLTEDRRGEDAGRQWEEHVKMEAETGAVCPQGEELLPGVTRSWTRQGRTLPRVFGEGAALPTP